ncbi:MAG: type I glyceraldehyde-3-phosphate dehydrogenase [Candidatus Taylorbacteria bacterium]|nr:type I glyceraldehyde-3-phosphate dehydrogenase [Candidatus Taylorbacteria bacterium]
MKKIRVAINGFGRIGRAFFKMALEKPELTVVAVNDLGEAETFGYLLTYDTVYGKYDKNVRVSRRAGRVFLEVDKKEIDYLSEKEPEKLPWRELDIDVVVEATGRFSSFEKSKAHLTAGAKRVVMTAPAGDEPETVRGATVLIGVNEEKLKTCEISSNASCTTNAGSPLLAILDETVGVEKALLTTVHAYTATQTLVDGPSKRHLRDGRAGAENIIPSSTGAAVAVTKAYTALKGLFDGISIRVPVVVGSIVDVTLVARRATSADEVNKILKKAASSPRWKDIFTVTEENLVSSDIKGSRYAAIADLQMTRVVGGNLVKVLAWYDNEMGYASTLVEHVIKAGQYI